MTCLILSRAPILLLRPREAQQGVFRPSPSPSPRRPHTRRTSPGRVVRDSEKGGSGAPETHPMGSLQASSERLVRDASRVPERPTTPASASTRDRARRLRPAPSTRRFRGFFWGRQAVRQNRTPFSNPFDSASISTPIGNGLLTHALSPRRHPRRPALNAPHNRVI